MNEADRCLLNWLSCRLVRGPDGKGMLLASHKNEQGMVRRLFKQANQRGLKVVPGQYLPPPWLASEWARNSKRGRRAGPERAEEHVV